MTPEQRQTVRHTIAAYRVVEGILSRTEAELRTVRNRLEALQGDLARLLHEDAAEVAT